MDQNNYDYNNNNYDNNYDNNYNNNYDNNYDYNGAQNSGNAPQPAKGVAIASMAVGICALCCSWEGSFSIVGLIAGIVGLALSSKAKKAGNTSGFAKAGFATSLISVILGGLVFVICGLIIGAIGGVAAGLGGMDLGSLFDL